MKKNKILALGLVTVMSMGVIAGCKKDEAPKDTEKPGTETSEGEGENEATSIDKVGLGIITSIGKSKEKTEDGAEAAVDTTMAAVAFDKDGKIVSVSIDVVQNKVVFDKDMNIASKLDDTFKSKKELKEAYGMKSNSEIEKEWFEQIEALEKWMVGKTVEEVKNMKTVERDENHTRVPDEEDLKTTVTITVETYIGAVDKAWQNAVEAKGGVKLGLGQTISLEKSKSQTEDKGALGQVDTTISAVVLDKDGKVVRTIVDTAQTKVQFDKEGKLETSTEAASETKKELGEKYGLKNASGIKKEWFEQIASLEEWTVGKTDKEITAMKIEDGVSAEEDLKTSVTIKVAGYIEAINEAYQFAK